MLLFVNIGNKLVFKFIVLLYILCTFVTLLHFKNTLFWKVYIRSRKQHFIWSQTLHAFIFSVSHREMSTRKMSKVSKQFDLNKKFSTMSNITIRLVMRDYSDLKGKQLEWNLLDNNRSYSNNSIPLLTVQIKLFFRFCTFSNPDVQADARQQYLDVLIYVG